MSSVNTNRGEKTHIQSSIGILTVITILYVIHAIDRGIIGILLQPIGRDFDLTDAQLGVLAGVAYGLPYALASVPLGLMVDRVNRCVLLGIMVALWSGMTMLCAGAQTFAMLLLCRAGVGASEAASGPGCSSIIGDLWPAERRAGALGILYLGSSLGGAVAGIGGAWLAQHAGWREALFVAGVPGLILAGVLIFLTREPARGKFDAASLEPFIDKRPALKGMADLFAARPALKYLFAAAGLGGIALSSLAAWMVPLMIREHGLSLSTAGFAAGIILGLGTGTSMVFGGVVANMLKSVPRALTLAGIALVLSVPVLMLALNASGLFAIVGLLLVWQLLTGSYVAPASAAIMNAVPPSLRGGMFSLREILISFVGVGIGPAIVGFLSSAIGGEQSLRTALLLTCGISGLITAMLLLRASRLTALSQARN